MELLEQAREPATTLSQILYTLDRRQAIPERTNAWNKLEELEAVNEG